MKKKFNPYTPGFTLIEILVVIAILAILIAIALPIMGKVRERADTAKGISNLRQLGALFHTFAGENNGRLPYQQSSSSSTWHIDIGAYLDISIGDFWNSRGKRPLDIFACPASDNLTRPGNYSDYGMNFLVGDHPVRTDQNRVISLPKPSETMLLADSMNCSKRLSPYDTNGGIDARHADETANFLFVDGHVETLPLAKFTTEIIGDPRFQPPWGWEGWTARR